MRVFSIFPFLFLVAVEGGEIPTEPVEIGFEPQYFIDDYLVADRTDWLRPIVFGLCVTAVIHTLLDYLQQRYLLRLQTKLALTSSSTFIWHPTVLM